GVVDVGGAGGVGGGEVDRAAGERSGGEVDRAAGERGAAEVDHAAGEYGAAEVERAAGELGAGEVSAVKNHPPEVEVKALPRRRRAVFQVGRDDPDDGMADLAAGPERKPLLLRGLVARVRLLGHAQVAAPPIHASLPLL